MLHHYRTCARARASAAREPAASASARAAASLSRPSRRASSTSAWCRELRSCGVDVTQGVERRMELPVAYTGPRLMTRAQVVRGGSSNIRATLSLNMRLESSRCSCLPLSTVPTVFVGAVPCVGLEDVHAGGRSLLEHVVTELPCYCTTHLGCCSRLPGLTCRGLRRVCPLALRSQGSCVQKGKGEAASQIHATQ